MYRVETGVGQQQCVGVRQPDVLRGEDHQPPCEEAWLLAPGQHARQIVDRGIGVAAPHRFDEGRDDVVVLLAVLVVEGDVLLQAVGDVLVGDRQFALRRPGQYVEDIEQLAGVAAREFEQRTRLLHFDLACFQFRVGRQRPVEQRLQVFVLQRFEDVDLATAQERRDHLERRVFGRGAYECHDALLDGSQQRILLAFVETVDFVDEQEGRLGVEKALFAGRLDHFAHVLDARRDGREREERTVELRGDDLRQRGFTHARRAPEYERRHVARFEELAEHAVLTHEVLLPDIFVYRAGAQSFG